MNTPQVQDNATDLEKVLMSRNKMTRDEARQEIADAKEELRERLEQGEMPFDICEELFGLEPDYLTDLM